MKEKPPFLGASVKALLVSLVPSVSQSVCLRVQYSWLFGLT